MNRPLNAAALRGAIVDLDGTMVDTLGDFEVSLNAALADLSLPLVDRRFLELTVGKGSEHLIQRALEQAGADASLYDKAWALYQQHYQQNNGLHSAVYPGVTAGLQRLCDRGWKLACVTNKSAAFANKLLAAKGLAGYFTVVFGGDAFARKKPDPLPLLKACEALALLPAQALMIGDSSNDAQAARSAACPVWLVSYGYNHGRPLGEIDCDGVVDRLDLLPLG